MVKTRVELREKIVEYVKNLKQDEFTTKNVLEHARKIAPNIKTSAPRIQNFIRPAAKFNKRTGVWTRCLKLNQCSKQKS